MRSLTDLGSALATYVGLSYFGKLSFLSFMSCLHTNRFSYEGCTIYVHYYSSLFNGRIHSNIHLFIHVIHSILLSIFPVYACENYLSSNIYFHFFLLTYLVIALEIIFLHIFFKKGRKGKLRRSPGALAQCAIQR